MAVGITNFPAALDTSLTLVPQYDAASTITTTTHTNSVTTFTVADTSRFPSAGIFTIRGEHVVYTGKTATTFTGCTRAQFTADGGAAAASHPTGALVELLTVAAQHRVQNDALIAVEGKLGTGASTAASGQFLKGTGTGTSGWSALSAAEVKTAAGITGDVVGTSDTQSLSGKTFNTLKATDLAGTGTRRVGANDAGTLVIDTTPTEAFLAGMMMPYAGTAAPSGWLLCDGTAVSRTTYSALFAVTGTAYGVGNGSTTFNLPDLRGRVPAGKAATGTFATLGGSGGAETVTLTAAQSGIPDHSHSVWVSIGSAGSHSHGGNTGTTTPSHTHVVPNYVSSYTTRSDGTAQGSQTFVNSAAIASGQYTGSGGGNHSHTIGSDGSHSHSASAGSYGQGAAAAAEAHTNIQPYQIVNYIIKA